MADSVHYSIEQLWQIAYDTLIMFGLSEDDAKIGADVLNAADIRGIDSHGVARLEWYAPLISEKAVDPKAELTLLNETPATAYLDANYGLGIVQAPKAMDIAIEKAKKCGVGLASVVHAGHFGIAGYYALKAAEQGMIGFAAANAIPCVTPYGGVGKVLGNSPFSIAFPEGDDGRKSTMFDGACSTVAVGKVQEQLRKKEKLPEGWAIDKDGKPITEPIQVLQPDGGLTPFGGVKGYCIDVMIEMMSAVLPGSSTGADVGGFMTRGVKEDIGYFFLAVDAGQFRPMEDIRTDIAYYNDKLKATRPATGVSEVFLPGELEFKTAARRITEGVDVKMAVIKDLLRISRQFGRLPKEADADDYLALYPQ
jgi:L-2-hydroxycarboxylate dehydrogenase (NAD+)